jgi:hypothetical protein
MKRVIAVASLLAGLFASFSALADCRCVCMNGDVQAVCSSSLDIEPICPPRVCPITPPSVEPIQQPRVPPIGTSNCVQRQVYNEYTRRYEWKEVCY